MNSPTVDSIQSITSTAAPPPEMTISQWADKYRYLSSEASAEPGKWNTDRAEYQREIMDEVTNPLVTDLVACGCAQYGKTEILNNIVGYYIDQDPSPIMVVQPTIDMAEEWSTVRLDPMVRDTERLYEKIKRKARDTKNTILKKMFPGGNLSISGANSPASLAGKPKRIVIGDDVDRFPTSAGEEGDPVFLMFKRCVTFWNKKRLLFSTPTHQESRIWKAFLETDQRYYHVPCSKCGESQTLKWKDDSGNWRVKWETNKSGEYVEGSAHYECEHCHGELYDRDIIWMVKNGKWIAKKPFKGKAGFHINELYSPWVTLEDTVVEFLRVKDDREQLKTWVNTALGEIFVERGEAPEWERLYMLRERYTIGIIPKGGIILVAGADVHDDRIEAEVVAYGKGKESWSVCHRILSGDTETSGPWEELDDLMGELFPYEEGGESLIRMLAIDARYKTQKVYNWTRKHPGRTMAVMGMHSLGAIVGTPRFVDIMIDGRKYKRGAKMWPLGVSILKSELYGFLRLEKEGNAYPPGYCHFPEYEEEHFKQLVSESLHTIRGRTRDRYEWRQDRPDNHGLDMRNYARGAAAVCGIDAYTDDVWDMLRNKNTGVAKKAPVDNAKRSKGRNLSKGIDI